MKEKWILDFRYLSANSSELEALLDSDDLAKEGVILGTVTFSVFRGEPDADGDPFGKMIDYTIELDEGMVVLDAIHSIQAEFAPDWLVDGIVRLASVDLAVLK